MAKDKKLNILLLTNEFPPHIYGGAGVHVEYLSKGLAGLEGGIFLVGALMIGHWSADTLWLTLVATGVSKGSTIFSDMTYRKIIALCGIFLILFGLYYLSRLFILP